MEFHGTVSCEFSPDNAQLHRKCHSCVIVYEVGPYAWVWSDYGFSERTYINLGKFSMSVLCSIQHLSCLCPNDKVSYSLSKQLHITWIVFLVIKFLCICILWVCSSMYIMFLVLIKNSSPAQCPLCRLLYNSVCFS